MSQRLGFECFSGFCQRSGLGCLGGGFKIVRLVLLWLNFLLYSLWIHNKNEPVTTNSNVPEQLQIGSKLVPLLFVQSHQARRYLLSLRPDGIARVTVPRRGSISTAREFVGKHIDWLEQQLQKLEPRPKTEWKLGTEILFLGEPVKIEFENIGQIRFGTEVLRLPDLSKDLRPAIQKHLYKLAQHELSARTWELAKLHGIEVARVSVRNQRSRWGSCSRTGTISLNWRLIQAPDFVRDYIILHELAHRRHMNHSDRFWEEVERLCPGYLAAERWIKTNRLILL